MDILQYLDQHNIPYERHEHPPVYTAEELESVLDIDKGVMAKNLFLRDDKPRRHFLLIAPHNESVDLKSLAAKLGVKRLCFGSPDRLRRYLKVETGAVSILTLVNDPESKVEVVIDSRIWAAEHMQCHPLVNSSTLVIAHKDIERFLEDTGHKPRILDQKG